MNCIELRERASRLAILNIQLVKAQEDDKTKAILIFTMVTITFLPLTFTPGIFGMNLADISRTASSDTYFWASAYFWVIAVPVTYCVVVACQSWYGLGGSS